MTIKIQLSKKQVKYLKKLAKAPVDNDYCILHDKSGGCTLCPMNKFMSRFKIVPCQMVAKTILYLSKGGK